MSANGLRGRIGYAIATRGYDEAEHARRRAVMTPWLPDGVELEIIVVPNGPEFLDRRSDFAAAVAAAEALFNELDRDRFDVIISAGAIDPGLARFRDRSPVPVIGPGEAAMYFASLVGRPLSIVTVDEHAVATSHEMLAAVPAKPPIASVRSIDMPVRSIVQDLDAGRDALLTTCISTARDDGAEVVYLGAVTLGMLEMDERIRAVAGVKVINPIRVAIAAAVECLAM